MRQIIFITILSLSGYLNGYSQSENSDQHFYILWNGSVFKSWLMDEHVGFNKIGSNVSPVFNEQHKMGLAINANFLTKPFPALGAGLHLGLGVDLNSIPVPLLLFGGSLTIGKKDEFVINAGWADGKRRIIPESLKMQLLNQTYNDIPELYDHTELNTGFYIGLGFKLF